METICYCGKPMDPRRPPEVMENLRRVAAAVRRAAPKDTAEGLWFTTQLHDVVHDADHPGVDYAKILRWERRVRRRSVAGELASPAEAVAVALGLKLGEEGWAVWGEQGHQRWWNGGAWTEWYEDPNGEVRQGVPAQPPQATPSQRPTDEEHPARAAEILKQAPDTIAELWEIGNPHRTGFRERHAEDAFHKLQDAVAEAVPAWNRFMAIAVFSEQTAPLTPWHKVAGGHDDPTPLEQMLGWPVTEAFDNEQAVRWLDQAPKGDLDTYEAMHLGAQALLLKRHAEAIDTRRFMFTAAANALRSGLTPTLDFLRHDAKRRVGQPGADRMDEVRQVLWRLDHDHHFGQGPPVTLVQVVDQLTSR